MTQQGTFPLAVRYAARSTSQSDAAQSKVSVVLDGVRAPVGVSGDVKDPTLFRDALMTAGAILGSDLRYKGKDRAAYLAFLMKKGKKANAQIWEAQKQFLASSFADETRKTSVLDPLLSVHPDEVSLEVFSQDESMYARLAFSNEMFQHRKAMHGTSFVDLPAEMFESLDRLATHIPLHFEAGASNTGTAWDKAQATRAERSLEIPYSWVRGFVQVQSSAVLPATTCSFSPIDFYNLLFALRVRKAKKPPRALRFEMVPGHRPRMVIEPWEIVLEGHGPVYEGKLPRVVRTYGRQRLATLSRILPHVRGVQIRTVGPGLPVFWVLDLGLATLTLALTGWTESGWSSAAAFDHLMPPKRASALGEDAFNALNSKGPLSLEDLQKAVGGEVADVRSAMQFECLRGRVLYDLKSGLYRPRDLLGRALDTAAIWYGSEREARAHRLLGDESGAQSEIKITKLHEIAGEGVEIHGEVNDKTAQRSYAPRFLLDPEGRTRDAWCSCPQFRRAGMREGPCEHMIALRLAFSRQRAQEEARRNSPEGRAAVRAETRTYLRRDESGKETVVKLSLDGKSVASQWGLRLETPRRQKLWFDSDKEAREAYFSRTEKLLSEGFIDAESSVA